MKSNRTRHDRSRFRRCSVEPLEGRYVLATISLIPVDGFLSSEVEANGDRSVFVRPGSTIRVRAEVTDPDAAIDGMRLDLSTSSDELVINNYVGGDFVEGFDAGPDLVLNSEAGDYSVSAASLVLLSLPPPRSLGEFDVTVPSVESNLRYILASNEDLSFLVSGSDSVSIDDFDSLTFVAVRETLEDTSLAVTDGSVSDLVEVVGPEQRNANFGNRRFNRVYPRVELQRTRRNCSQAAVRIRYGDR